MKMMSKVAAIIALLLCTIPMHAQIISYIETTKSWYYIYDHDGKKIKTLSRSIGELQGFSSSFFIVKTNSWYYIYDAKGNKIRTFSVSSIGKILSVSGDTFVSQSGSWIYTWHKDGKKIATRTAR